MKRPGIGARRSRSSEAYSGAVTVEQTGSVIAGDFLTGEGDGIDATAAAEADAELQQVAVQDNTNSQSATTNLTFTASGTFNTVAIAAGDDAEIGAGIEDVEAELEQEQEEIDQDNEADQYAVADAYAAYTGFGEAVSVVQSGTLEAAGTGIEAEARSDADAELSQIADQGNENSQTATPTVAFTAAPTFGTPTGTANVTIGGTGVVTAATAALLLLRSTTPRSRPGSTTSRLRSSRSRRTSISRTMPTRMAPPMPRRIIRVTCRWSRAASCSPARWSSIRSLWRPSPSAMASTPPRWPMPRLRSSNRRFRAISIARTLPKTLTR